MSQFRYHPIIENLKINEDGTVIELNGEPMNIKEQKLPHLRRPRKIVYVGAKTVNTIRLVCEAWHGIAPSGEHAARRVDEDKGDHYSNLCWGKKGMTLSAVKTNSWNTRGIKMTAKLYAKIKKRQELENIVPILADLKISTGVYYKYKKAHAEKN